MFQFLFVMIDNNTNKNKQKRFVDEEPWCKQKMSGSLTTVDASLSKY